MWRDLTPPEAASLPEARLGGALMAMFVCAVLLVVALVLIVIVSGVTLVVSGNHLRLMGGRQLASLLLMAPIGFAMLLAAVFAVMTVARARATPVVLSWGMIAWLVARLVFTVGGQVVIATQVGRGGGAMLLSLLVPVLISLLADAIAVAALCGYMADGTRPNAYYLRRVRTGANALTPGVGRL